MTKKYWFQPKTYGYGLFPISWEGWVMTLIFVGLIMVSAYTNNIFTDVPSSQNVWRFLFDLFILSCLLLIFAKDRTDGEIRWNWGKIRK